MSSILRIQFPKDFEERYEKYTASLKGVDAEIVGIIPPITKSTRTPKKEPVRETRAKQKPKSSTKDVKKFPHKLPAGTRWENFTIQFLSDERVSIQVMGKEAEVDYKAMGFEDKRNGKSDSQWKFLLLLAKLHGEISWKDLKSESKLKKHKERLTARLQDYFSIDYDPFHSYMSKKSYKIKIILVPPFHDEESVKTLSQETEEMFADLVDDNA